MNPTSKLEKQLAAAKEQKRKAVAAAARIRKKLQERKRQQDASLAIAIGRVCMETPLTPEALALLRHCQGKLREDLAAQVRGMIRDAEARQKNE